MRSEGTDRERDRPDSEDAGGVVGMAPSAELYRLLIERAADGIAIIQDGQVVFANGRVSEIIGYSFDEIASRPFQEFIAPSDRAQVLERYELRMRGEVVPPTYEASLVHKEGRPCRVEISAGLITYRGRPADLAIVRDVTDRCLADEGSRQIERRIRQLHQVAAELADCATEDEVFRVAIEAAEGILSLSICTLDLVEGDRLVVKATSSGAPTGASQSRPMDEGGLAAKTLRTGRSYVFGTLAEEPDAVPTQAAFESGLSVPIGSLGILQAASTEPGAFTTEDVRVLEVLARHTASALERIRLQAELREQAIHDPLTGVFNRRFAQEAIERELARCRESGRPLMLLMADINRFKEINDRFGHQAGDRVLTEVASVLCRGVRDQDLVIRYGGDEFLILMPEAEGEVDALIASLHDGVARWSESDGTTDFPITLAIGSARYDPAAGGTWEDVLHLADRRMYEDKRNGSVSPVEAEG
ncbi:MAG: diguanylate cyclase [Candidatus Bipolaricaulota bacterium]|nr:MAG: diguanylate cyclase [Candidatus Bipolaricaulota bacterium]